MFEFDFRYTTLTGEKKLATVIANNHTEAIDVVKTFDDCDRFGVINFLDPARFLG